MGKWLSHAGFPLRLGDGLRLHGKNRYVAVKRQGTVPQAIIAFLESTDFEDAIRNAISLGGDSDTLAAITGGIAEAAYGVPQWMKEKAWKYLDEPLREVCRQWEDYLAK